MKFINTGKNFELEFIKALDNHYYDELNSNLKKFLLFIFKDINHKNKIYCKKIQKNEKADISIKIGNAIKYVSLKTGSENSVHVEKIEEFIKFLSKLGINEKLISSLLLYHYGDDTLTGNGKIRYSANEAKIRYKTQILEFNKCINYSNNLSKIIERFLLIGNNPSNKYVDAIYYGNLDIGIWCSKEEILNFCINHKSMHIITPHFSVFVYQNWCRNISFTKKSESHRQYIQIKWFSILSDLNKIRKTNAKNQNYLCKPPQT